LFKQRELRDIQPEFSGRIASPPRSAADAEFALPHPMEMQIFKREQRVQKLALKLGVGYDRIRVFHFFAKSKPV